MAASDVQVLVRTFRDLSTAATNGSARWPPCSARDTYFRDLLARGNSVPVIEHNIQLIEQSDWVIDLGPDGGNLGGEIVAVGAPDEVAGNERSLTGRYSTRAAAVA